MKSVCYLDICGIKIPSIEIDCPNIEILDISYSLLETPTIEDIISRIPKVTNFWAKKQIGITPPVLRYKLYLLGKRQIINVYINHLGLSPLLALVCRLWILHIAILYHHNYSILYLYSKTCILIVLLLIYW